MDPIARPRIIWLIEDHVIYSRTIQRVIGQIEGLTCPRAFERCETCLDALHHDPPPDVLLLDLGLPGMGGLTALPQLKTLAPDAHILVLTVFDDQEKIFEAICAGASGYLLKTSSAEEITAAIHEVLDGGAPMTASIAHKVLGMFKHMARPQGEYGLTPREKEILEWMVEGLTKKEIASRLDLSPHTVDTHLRSIYGKLQVHTRTGAVSKALRERLC
jgi:DNA-binding NarL/FixJ family response regulator